MVTHVQKFPKKSLHNDIDNEFPRQQITPINQYQHMSPMNTIIRSISHPSIVLSKPFGLVQCYLFLKQLFAKPREESKINFAFRHRPPFAAGKFFPTNKPGTTSTNSTSRPSPDITITFISSPTCPKSKKFIYLRLIPPQQWASPTQ